MKKVKSGTWIAIGCVIVAVLVTQIYNGIQNNTGEKEDVSVISESFPTPPPPVATPSVKETPSPSPIAKMDYKEVDAAPVNAEVESQTELDFYLPSSGEVIRQYSDKELVCFTPIKEWRCHLGVDFAPTDNDLVLSVADGVVEKIYDDHLFGTTVTIDHGGTLKSNYSSLSSVSVTEGQSVSAGTEIGHMGETAIIEPEVHLHFSMEKDGKPIDPMGEK